MLSQIPCRVFSGFSPLFFTALTFRHSSSAVDIFSHGTYFVGDACPVSSHYAEICKVLWELCFFCKNTSEAVFVFIFIFIFIVFLVDLAKKN